MAESQAFVVVELQAYGVVALQAYSAQHPCVKGIPGALSRLMAIANLPAIGTTIQVMIVMVVVDVAAGVPATPLPTPFLSGHRARPTLAFASRGRLDFLSFACSAFYNGGDHDSAMKISTCHLNLRVRQFNLHASPMAGRSTRPSFPGLSRGNAGRDQFGTKCRPRTEAVTWE